MAEGDEPSKFENYKSNYEEDSETEEPVKLDLINLGSNKSSDLTPEHTTHGQGSSHDSTVRREENPFSFKHFLRNDKNYQNLGARPKVYCEGRRVINSLDQPAPEPKHSRIGPEFSSALPDFVQDHLVIEQCYLGNNSPNGSNPNLYNLPDFTPNRSNSGRRLSGESSKQLENRRENNSSNSINVPLDLPIRPQVEFPLDLPIGELQTGSRSCPPTSEVGNSKSLPDFLADGAVKTQNNDCINGGQSPDRDCERLRQELDLLRRQLNEQIRRSDYLSRELEAARSKEHEYTQNLAKALEQVEENLERSNMRAASSESTILKLRQEVKTLMSEINVLRRENDILKNGEGATGGPSYRIPSEIQAQHFAYELRQAANTAEHSLRQLLSGVDNLRMLASSVESMSRVERIDPYQSDPEDDTGPAL